MTDTFWKGTALESVETMLATAEQPDCGTAEADDTHPLFTTEGEQAYLVERLAEILDDAMHLEACFVTPDETACVCIVGGVRAVLPACGQAQQHGARSWRCLRSVHPSEPDRHYFGEV